MYLAVLVGNNETGGSPLERIYVSHLSSEQYGRLVEQWPEVGFAMRLGTDLWLADKSFITTKSTVLDVQSIRRGERFGSGARRMPPKRALTGLLCWQDVGE